MARHSGVFKVDVVHDKGRQAPWLLAIPLFLCAATCIGFLVGRRRKTNKSTYERVLDLEEEESDRDLNDVA